MASNKAFPVSWEQFHRDARALAWRLAGSGPFKGLVAITRGGLVPAAIIARELDLRLIETICISSYDNYKNQSGLNVIKPISAELAGDGTGLLVIDDLVDTGKTAREVRDMLPKAHFATVYAKPKGIHLVDTTAINIDQHLWLVFPWDQDI